MWRGLFRDIGEQPHYFWLWKIRIQFPLGNIVIGIISIRASVFFGSLEGRVQACLLSRES